MVAWWLVLLLAPNILSGNWYSLHQIKTGKEHVLLTKGLILLHVAGKCFTFSVTVYMGYIC